MNKLMKQEFDDHEEDGLKKSQEYFWKRMEIPELSLAPNSSLASSETSPSRKRKSYSDHLFNTEPMIQTSVDLQLKDPLPLDWEQCLDLQSGRMYYLNRKTLRKSWEWPNDHENLDLELNISTCSEQFSSGCQQTRDNSKAKQSSNNSTNMVALACLNCHLLVILSKSSPSCPNCKYVHSLPEVPTMGKSLDTLSLLN